ncbi:MAG: FHA domain-containing protein [Nitrospinae bacterium]|nr:FHA domain-containing protein [Nitrospinota bacterium]
MSEHDASLCLYVSGQKGEEKVYPLNKNGLLIGRDPACEICLPDTSISKKHARVLVDNGRTLIEDGVDGKRSSNGVYVNDSRITTPVTLREGDVVKMGVLRFDVKYTSSITSPLTLPEVTDLPALKLFLERGDLRKVREEDVLGRVAGLGLGGAALNQALDEALDRVMDRNELWRVALISKLKQNATPVSAAAGRKSQTVKPPAPASFKDADMTMMDMGISSSSIRQQVARKKGKFAIMAVLAALAIVMAVIFYF